MLQQPHSAELQGPARPAAWAGVPCLTRDDHAAGAASGVRPEVAEASEAHEAAGAEADSTHRWGCHRWGCAACAVQLDMALKATLPRRHAWSELLLSDSSCSASSRSNCSQHRPTRTLTCTHSSSCRNASALSQARGMTFGTCSAAKLAASNADSCSTDTQSVAGMQTLL